MTAPDRPTPRLTSLTPLLSNLVQRFARELTDAKLAAVIARWSK